MKEQEKNLGLLAHLLAFVGFFVPFGNIIGPLVIYLLEKGKFSKDCARHSLNFQISITMYTLALMAIAFAFFVSLVAIPLLPVIMLILMALAIYAVVVVIIAAVKASNGESYKYPLEIEFIK